ncbi:MAG: glycine-rich domain-containing protein [Gammaproteobacteria bacterium]
MHGINYGSILSTLPHSMQADLKAEDTPSLGDAVKYIDSIDFSEIERKLHGYDPLLCRRWSRDETEIGIQYYKNFLYLNKKYQDKFPVIPPMLEVDEIWHHHILDTRKYMTDCQNIFGYYFHHYPYFGARGNSDKNNLDASFAVAQLLHEHEFGCEMIAIWDN